MLYNIRKAASERKLTLSTFDILLPIKIAVNISMYIARPIKLTAFVLIKNESNLNDEKPLNPTRYIFNILSAKNIPIRYKERKKTKKLTK